MELRPKIDPEITAIVARLQEAGYESYLVGGAVRDFLLDRQPKDYDLSTAATPEQIRKVFRDRRTVIIGRRFQLVHLFLGRDIIEISTFRKRPSDAQQHDRPLRCVDAPEKMIFRDNEFGTSLDDAYRRDFTVNAIFYDPVHDKLLDYTNQGLSDIQSGLVRIIGKPEVRFEEDPVRLLRALKLVGQYGFALEEKTEKALHQCLPLIRHAAVSRLSLELEKILKNAYGDRILAVFEQFGFLQYYLPFLHENFRSPRMDQLFRLYAVRNRRILDHSYRASLSLAAAMFAIPFMEEKMNSEEGGLWDYHSGIEPELYDLIAKIFAPLALTRRTVSASVTNLMLQNRLKTCRKLSELQTRLAYMNARELAVIQNSVSWNISDFESACPQVFISKKRKPRKRSPRRDSDRKNRQETPSEVPAALPES